MTEKKKHSVKLLMESGHYVHVIHVTVLFMFTLTFMPNIATSNQVDFNFIGLCKNAFNISKSLHRHSRRTMCCVPDYYTEPRTSELLKMQLNFLDLFSTKDLVSIMTDPKWFKHSYKELGKEHVQFNNNKNNNNGNNNTDNSKDINGNNNYDNNNKNDNSNNDSNNKNENNNNNNANNNNKNGNNNSDVNSNGNDNNNNNINNNIDNNINNNVNNNVNNNDNNNNSNKLQSLEIDITEQRQKQEDHGLHVATKFTVNVAKHMVKTGNFTLTKEHLFQIHSRVLGNVFKNYAGK